MRALTLHSCQMSWSHMSIIQSLPNLQFLKLKHRAFEGSCWNTDGQEFQQLTFLRLEGLNIKEWEACILSFPCLGQLEIYSCKDLKGIPLEIGDIPTLELIRINDCNDFVSKSVKRIQEEQNDLGNFDLKIELGRAL
ncbi:hypothetical protein SSX86_028544 [Deinandra increscens subsp. villosa]|uniref:Uncharacterized protein n=1 Tax=Deinandra increscens subsp. villosa TaxID=3103831 RepID=A0AAP0GJQ5_9ASTR